MPKTEPALQRGKPCRVMLKHEFPQQVHVQIHVLVVGNHLKIVIFVVYLSISLLGQPKQSATSCLCPMSCSPVMAGISFHLEESITPLPRWLPDLGTSSGLSQVGCMLSVLKWFLWAFIRAHHKNRCNTFSCNICYWDVRMITRLTLAVFFF